MAPIVSKDNHQDKQREGKKDVASNRNAKQPIIKRFPKYPESSQQEWMRMREQIMKDLKVCDPIEPWTRLMRAFIQSRKRPNQNNTGESGVTKQSSSRRDKKFKVKHNKRTYSINPKNESKSTIKIQKSTNDKAKPIKPCKCSKCQLCGKCELCELCIEIEKLERDIKILQAL